jgi:hypothetical protein
MAPSAKSKGCKISLGIPVSRLIRLSACVMMLKTLYFLGIFWEQNPMFGTTPISNHFGFIALFGISLFYQSWAKKNEEVDL